MMKFLTFIIVGLFITGCDNPIPQEIVDPYPLDVIWELQYNHNGWGADAPPTLINDSLLLFTGDNNISCIRIDSGSSKWISTHDYAGSQLKRFVFDESNIFGFRGRNNIYALDIMDGTTQWEKDIDSCQSFSFRLSADLEHYFVGISSYRDNIPYSIQKYNKAGVLLDSVATDHMPWVLSNNENRLFCSQGWSPADIPNDIGQIICFDIITMDTLWNYAGSGSFIHSPLFQDGIMYVGTVWGVNNKTLALNAETGEVIWENENYGAHRIIVVGDTLYREVSSAIFAMDKTTGEDLWRTNLSNPDESPTISYWEGYLYVENVGNLFILNAETGEIAHKVYGGPDGSGIEQVSTGAGKVFIQTSRHLYAFSPYDPSQSAE